MRALELVAEVDAHRRLQLELPEATMPGPVRVLVLLPEAEEPDAVSVSEDADAAWMRGVAHEWRADLADPREDIYTLDDGEPIHAAG